jgi:predicted amidophosphoribosyltransferase
VAMSPDRKHGGGMKYEKWPPPGPKRTGGGEPRCPECRAEVHRDDQFCIRCGHQLVASVPRCNRCAAFVHQNDRFCIFCGTDLRVLKP